MISALTGTIKNSMRAKIISLIAIFLIPLFAITIPTMIAISAIGIMNLKAIMPNVVRIHFSRKMAHSMNTKYPPRSAISSATGVPISPGSTVIAVAAAAVAAVIPSTAFCFSVSTWYVPVKLPSSDASAENPKKDTNAITIRMAIVAICFLVRGWRGTKSTTSDEASQVSAAAVSSVSIISFSGVLVLVIRDPPFDHI